jgi:hypothetical protein
MVQFPILGVQHSDTIQEAAMPLLACAGKDGVNGRLTYGAFNIALNDNMRYYLCITGGQEEGDGE